MRTKFLRLMAGLIGALFGVSGAGCDAILGNFDVGGAGDASVQETSIVDSSGDQDRHAQTDAPSTDSSHDGPSTDAMTSDVNDAHTEVPCTMTLCSGNCVDTMSSGTNCGKCGRSCFGGTCSAGVCSAVTMVSATSGLATIISDADTNATVVVWADNGDQTIDQVSTPGGSKIVIAPAISGTAVDSVALGVGGAFGYTTTSPGAFYNATLGMASSGVVNNTFGSSAFAEGLMWDPTGASAYMMEVADPSAGPYLIAQCTSGCAGFDVVFGANPLLSFDTGVGAAGVVFSDINLHTINVFDPSTDGVTTIAGQVNGYRVAADAANAYWTTSVGATNGIFSAASGSTTVNTVLANATGGPLAKLASDGTNVYFVNAGGLFYVPVGGASSETALDTSSPNFGGVKYTNGALVYWTSTAIFLLATPL
jgi:Stigma-specific protein, Stig1